MYRFQVCTKWNLIDCSSWLSTKLKIDKILVTNLKRQISQNKILRNKLGFPNWVTYGTIKSWCMIKLIIRELIDFIGRTCVKREKYWKSLFLFSLFKIDPKFATMSPTNKPNTKVFVGGLPGNASKEDVKMFFSQYGSVGQFLPLVIYVCNSSSLCL